MPISRPLLIALIAAILGLGAFYATQGSRQAADAPAPATPEPAADPAPAPKPTADASKPSDSAKPGGADKAKADTDAAQRPVQIAKAERAPVKDKQKAEQKPARKAAVSGPVAAKRAIRGDKTVVLYFYGPESADDSATGRAVAGLNGMRNVTVFKAPIRRLTAYGDLVGQLGIAQAPAVVIVGRGRSARVIEGYVDPPTLRQDVADAR